MCICICQRRKQGLVVSEATEVEKSFKTIYQKSLVVKKISLIS